MRTRKKRKLKAEINVVPYIDVMLVLLIIFMVTAPLLNLGVDIKLPQSTAKAVSVPKEPILIGVDKDGKFYLTKSGAQREQMSPEDIVKQVTAIVHQNPDAPVIFGADARVPYGTAYQILPGLMEAGVTHVQLISQPLQDSK
jgi:biopolymer transport protein TolR